MRFATWVGHGRDPQVAYLDDSQLVIGHAELRADGWYLDPVGTSYNVRWVARCQDAEGDGDSTTTRATLRLTHAARRAPPKEMPRP